MSIIEHPLVMEKAMNQMDFDNKLQFIVHIDSTKPNVESKVESRYDVTVEKVNVQVTMKGRKKATARLSEDDDAREVTSRIGMF